MEVVFLGLAERATQVREGSSGCFKWNVIGLKHIWHSIVYPLGVTGAIGLAVHSALAEKGFKLKMKDSLGKEIMTASLNDEKTVSVSEAASPSTMGIVHRLSMDGWTPTFFSIASPGFLIPEPGEYSLALELEDGKEETLGKLHFLLVNPLPLTADRIAAIRADPKSMNAVRAVLTCKQCPSKLKTYAGLERSPDREAEGWVWYESLPDRFACECGKTSLSLVYYRKNLLGFVGGHTGGSGDVNLLPLYERSALQALRIGFVEVLNAHPKEEELQQFIQNNPILLHQFPATRLFAKPPILTMCKADFALITPSKELLLIELERTTTKLMIKDGGIAAELSHAIDQVRDWLHIVSDQRLAVLDCLGVARDEVSSVKGIVIAGRDQEYEEESLRRLKGQDRGQILVLTYDDLLGSLDVLIRDFRKL